ncbi:hypothetical protein [Azospirillum doebereinerae]
MPRRPDKGMTTTELTIDACTCCPQRAGNGRGCQLVAVGEAGILRKGD